MIVKNIKVKVKVKVKVKKYADLEDFSKFNDCFMNYSTYTVELEKLEKK